MAKATDFEESFPPPRLLSGEKNEFENAVCRRNGEEMLEPYEREILMYVLRRGKGSNPFPLVDYCSHEYQKMISRYQMRCSMSKKGDWGVRKSMQT